MVSVLAASHRRSWKRRSVNLRSRTSRPKATVSAGAFHSGNTRASAFTERGSSSAARAGCPSWAASAVTVLGLGERDGPDAHVHVGPPELPELAPPSPRLQRGHDV